MGFTKIYEGEKLFDELLEKYELDWEWNGCLLNTTKYGHEEICRVLDKKTGHRVGRYVWEQFYTDAGVLVSQAYITID